MPYLFLRHNGGIVVFDIENPKISFIDDSMYRFIEKELEAEYWEELVIQYETKFPYFRVLAPRRGGPPFFIVGPDMKIIARSNTLAHAIIIATQKHELAKGKLPEESVKSDAPPSSPQR